MGDLTGDGCQLIVTKRINDVGDVGAGKFGKHLVGIGNELAGVVLAQDAVIAASY